MTVFRKWILLCTHSHGTYAQTYWSYGVPEGVAEEDGFKEGLQQFHFKSQNQPMLSPYPPCMAGPIWERGSNISNGLAKNEPVPSPINGTFGNPEILEKKMMDFLNL